MNFIRKHKLEMW